MANDGWYKVPRTALVKYGFTDKLLAYNDLAARADYETGEVIHSIKGVALKWGWSRKKARAFLEWALPMIREMARIKAGATELPPQGPRRDTQGTPQGTPKSREKAGVAGDEGHPKGHTWGHGGTPQGPRSVHITKKNKEEEEYTAPPTGGVGQNSPPTEILPSTNGNRDKVPQPPGGQHKPFHFLAWNFYEGWQALFGNAPFDPWLKKNRGVFKGIMDDLAKGDYREGVRRLRIFFNKCAENPNNDWWVYTPTKFRQRWDECVGRPMFTMEKQSREGQTRSAFADRMAALQEKLENERTGNVV